MRDLRPRILIYQHEILMIYRLVMFSQSWYKVWIQRDGSVTMKQSDYECGFSGWITLDEIRYWGNAGSVKVLR